MTVLVTRPSPAGEQLVTLLVQAGIAACHTPLIEFMPGKDLPYLCQTLSRLRTGDIVMALSPRAVEYAQPILVSAGFVWPVTIDYFAIGHSTAQQLATMSQQPVTYPQHSEISECLLELPGLQEVAGKRIVMLRGNGGRELLADTLAKRGAQIIRMECYLRQTKKYADSDSYEYWKTRQVDTIVITSGEILIHLLNLVPATEHAWLFACRLIVVSQRLAEQARQLGWREISMADQANNEALIRALQVT